MKNGFDFDHLVHVTEEREKQEEIRKDPHRPHEAECIECGQHRTVRIWFMQKDPICDRCWFEMTG